jgi:DNA-binding response OmpR family regulator
VRFPPSNAPPRSDVPAASLRGSAHDCAIVIAVGDVSAGELVYRALSTLSSHVVLISSATEALRELEPLHPAVLVVDDELPLVRGLDLAGRVRSERSDVEIILITADDAVVSLVSRLHVERLLCISKPFDLELLRRAVGVSLRTVIQAQPAPAYADLAAELEDQKSRFERRIKNLERKRPSTPAPAPTAGDAAEDTAEDMAEAPIRTAPSTRPPEPAFDADEAHRVHLPDDLHVLVVDDDPLVRRAMARTLSKQHVTLAENGLAATRALERSRPDVIVSDLRMPEMDGLAFAEEVRRRWPELSDRIVFVSGTGSQIARAEVEAPSQRVLRKPVAGALLESRIAEILEKAMLARKKP